MKHRSLILLCLAAMLGACHHESDPLFGTWIVDKVNVSFDASHGTPELVKQIGKMEQQNVIVINADSTMTFKTMGDEQQGKLNLKGDGTLLFDDALFGTYKNGEIVTKTPSPLGEIVVTYRKR